MAAVIRDFKYSKTGGRGRGILGLKEFSACRKPGALESDTAAKESERGMILDYNKALVMVCMRVVKLSSCLK